MSVLAGAAASFILLFGSGSASGAKVIKCAGQRANVVGTPGVDFIDPGDLHSGDVVATLAGQDKITIDGVRNVLVCAGKASDDVSVYAGAGRGIVINGGPGSDGIGGSHATKDLILRGQNGNDGLYGGLGDDKMKAGTGVDRPYGGMGRDTINAGPGEDWVQGGGAADRLFGGPGDDNLFGVQFSKPPTKGRHDFGNGGDGRDYCQVARRKNCERTESEIPF